MLRVLLLFLILLAGIILGPMLAGHQGYVLIQTDNYNIETSVTAMIIILVLVFVALLIIEWILRRIFRTGYYTRGWFIGQKRNRASKQTKAALIKLAEGDFKQVEKLLTCNADHAEQPMVNYLLAAEAAQQRGDERRTNQYLERAAEVADTNQLPVDITRVRIQLAQGQIHAARHGVDRLLGHASQHPEVLRLAEQAFLSTGAHNALLDILPTMKKMRLHSEAEIKTLELQAYIGIMNQCMAEEGSEGLKRWWQSQPGKIRRESALQAALVEHLIECDDHQIAQQIILTGLKRQYDERLISLMPLLKSEDAKALEKSLRLQIKQQGATPLLNSTLGQLLLKQGEWEQASEAFRAALQQRPDGHDYALLADTLDKLHRPKDAAEVRHQGLLLTLKKNAL
ncbi:putative protoheme IX synthesis protein [Candidatus Regiella insecticola LSR1]|uniref:Putative protoheme IX synthesis protein n=1 Tax=Candidatus Regiella insecticola LSR1 TaxID=663321 RepID=E0WT76_9ENTR|nr:protoheme IX biogenesis protein HemY [Candidatus Regiella insecticola]EFL91761.1 putative protoheme IX synthesis protein [Candidatus Regiella insecticola LSR1]